MNIKIIHNPDKLTFLQFKEIDKECFPYEPFTINMFTEMMMNHIWVAFMKEKIVGYIYVKMECESAHLSRIGIRKSYRRKGIAKELINTMIRYCTEVNKHNVTLYVQTDNQPAINLYKKYGFIVKESRFQFVIPIRDIISTYRENVNYKLKAILNVKSNPIKDNSVHKKYNLDFIDCNGKIHGNCCLDPEFPGCSHFVVNEPDIYFIDSLIALETFLNPTKDELILTFKDKLLEKTCNKLGVKLNYELQKMQKILED